MILPMNSEYRIATDTYAWKIQQYTQRKRNGETVHEWKSIKWYGTLQQAVQGLANLMIMSCEAKTLADALAEVENVAATLCQALQPRFEVNPNPNWEQAKELDEKEATGRKKMPRLETWAGNVRIQTPEIITPRPKAIILSFRSPMALYRAKSRHW